MKLNTVKCFDMMKSENVFTSITMAWFYNFFRFAVLDRPTSAMQALDVCFLNKRDKGNYSPLHFNSTNIQVADSQKHLGLV